MNMKWDFSRLKQVAFIASFSMAVAVVSVGVSTGGLTRACEDVVFACLLVVMTPIAVIQHLEQKRRKAVDERLPDLFRMLVQAQEAGMSLPQALDEASKQKFGVLSHELEKISTKMSWGASFEDAVSAFAKRVPTLLVERTVPMITEASRAGGRVERIFEPMSKFLQTTLMLEKERRTRTKPYIAIIYIGLFVFIFTIILLFKTFFTSAEGVPLLATNPASPETMLHLFLHMTLIQGFFSGLVAGKMGEGSVTSGLKHSVVMITAGYVALRFLL